jgi:hypothetical protein
MTVPVAVAVRMKVAEDDDVYLTELPGGGAASASRRTILTS